MLIGLQLMTILCSIYHVYRKGSMIPIPLCCTTKGTLLNNWKQLKAMYALMHIAHLSASSLQTFSDPLAVHTTLYLPKPHSTEKRGDIEIRGNRRLMVSWGMLLRGDSDRERGPQRKCKQSQTGKRKKKMFVHSYSSPAQCYQNRSRENQGGDKRYGVIHQGLKLNLSLLYSLNVERRQYPEDKLHSKCVRWCKTSILSAWLL